MLPAPMLLPIKDLKDLSVFLSAVTIDIQDLKDLKRFFSRERSRGDRPPRYGPGRGSPRHAPVREQALPNYIYWGTRAIAGDRPPRYGETETAVLLTRSGSGDPELQFSAPNLANRDNLENPAHF